MGEVVVQLPRFFASLFKGEKEVVVDASTLGEAVRILSEKYGEEVRAKLLDEKGKIKAILNFYVNGKNVRFTGGLDTPLKAGDKIAILPAVAGG